jgi:hypothetical protein
LDLMQLTTPVVSFKIARQILVSTGHQRRQLKDTPNKMVDYSMSLRTTEAIKPGTPEAYGDQYVSIRSVPISVKIHNAIAFCI